MDISSLLTNILSVAIPLALLEISFEKTKGWGAGLRRDRWYGKVIGEKSPVLGLIASIIGVPYFFGYALFTYFFFVPLFLVFEHFYLGLDIIFLTATYIGILVVEDFLWFVLNPYFHSLQELLKGPRGNIWWHKRWFKIGNYYLPTSYLTGGLLMVCLIALSYFR